MAKKKFKPVKNSALVYGMPMCGDCDVVKEIFDEEGVLYEYRDIKASLEVEKEAEGICLRLGRKALSVPVIILNICGDTVNSVGEADIMDTTFSVVEPRGPALNLLRETVKLLKPHSSGPERG
ncbi:MAG: glutaredoxin domain-containing protein [bacterium]|nr:glutaredoxin domain-containing protein [bacterium]